MSGYPFEHRPRVINVADARLNMVLLSANERYASVSEYAAATGIDTADIIELLGPSLDSGALSLEVCGDEVFVHTAPMGRPAPAHHPDVRGNLWERFRDRHPIEHAYALWRLARDLEHAGWVIETDPAAVVRGLGRLGHSPQLGVKVGATFVPALIHPSMEALRGSYSLLSEYQLSGAVALALIVDNGTLDPTVTAVRQWTITQQHPTTLHVLILEAPAYFPTHLRPDDAAVTPFAVTRHVIDPDI